MQSKTVVFKNGIVIVLEDFITLETTIADNAEYAGIVAEKNGTLPHFLFFAEKPISELTADDENKIYDMCNEVYPEVEKVRKQEIEADFSKDGFITNGDAWKKAPRLGIFSEPEVKSKDELYLEIGMIREE